jgi:acetyl-CoA carboxylase biotin carboxyl carrier protein
MLTYDQIKELIQIVSERQLHELEIERSGFRLKITGATPAAQPAETRVASPAVANLSASPAQSAVQPAESRPAAVARAAAEDPAHVIISPIVGTFYSSPSPTAEPFVRVGDRVRKGQVLCIVEAMKLMNEIESDVEGTIVEIYPRNAQPVEFGEPLFGLRLE